MGKRVGGISAVLAASLIMSLTGCAGSSGGDNSIIVTESKETSDAPPTESSEAAESAESSEGGEKKPAEESSAPDSPESEPAADSAAGLTDDISKLVYDETDNTWAASDENCKKFVSIMKRECTKSPDIKGVYLLANSEGIIFAGGMNSEDINGKKVDIYTTYEIGSITKTFTAVAVLQLCEQGKLSLDDTLDKYFPEFERGRDISIYHLLHMRSGLRREFLYGANDTDIDMDMFKKYYNDGYTDDELLAALFGAELEFEPGTNARYSNAGYVLLAMIVEQLTGGSYADYVQKNIFDVCGMEHTSSMKFGDVTSVPEPAPEGHYDFDFDEVFDSPYVNWINSSRGAGDIHSCAADLLAFDRALMGGKLLNEKSLADMFDMDVRSEPYGCGWQFVSASEPDAYVHEGATPLFVSSNLCCKSEKYGNIYLIQLHSSLADLEYMASCEKNIVLASKT